MRIVGQLFPSLQISNSRVFHLQMTAKAQYYCFIAGCYALIDCLNHFFVFSAYQVHEYWIAGNPGSNGSIHFSNHQSPALPIVTIHQQFPGMHRLKTFTACYFNAGRIFRINF